MHPYPMQNPTFSGLSGGYEALFATSYRFGFNGKESDSEVKGEGNQQDYGFRIYDPRIAKFLSVDPLTKEYPWYTPYQFAGNKPIKFTDLDGLEECPAGQDYSVKKNENRTPGEVVGDFISGVLGDLEAVNDYFSNPETKVGVVEAIVASLNLSVLFIAPESTELKAARTTNTVRRAESVVVKVEKAEQVVVKTQTNTTTSVAKNAAEKVATKGATKLPSNIHPDLQGKHIVGHPKYLEGRSTLDANPQSLLDGVNEGKYKILRSNQNNVIVDFGKNIGTFFQNGNEIGPTRFGTVHYGKNGAHIVPANPIQY